MSVPALATTTPTLPALDMGAGINKLFGQLGNLATNLRSAQTESNTIEDLLTKLALSGADAKTLILARQILDCDQMISDNLKSIDTLNKLRQAHATRKQELLRVKAFVNKHSDKGKIGTDKMAKEWRDFVASNSDLAEKYDLIPMPAEWSSDKKAPDLPSYTLGIPNLDNIEQNRKAQTEWEARIDNDPNYSRDVSAEDYMGRLGAKLLGKQSYTDEGGAIKTSTSGSVFSGDVIDVDEIEAAIARQDDGMQKLDQAKELINIRNQQALQRKQRTLTLVSNFNQAEHEGRKAVITNTRA